MISSFSDDEQLPILGRLYDDIVDDYVRIFFHDLTDAPWLDRFLSSLGHSSHVLDIGCGPGNFAMYLSGQGRAVVGIDISYGMIQAARRLVPSAHFVLMDSRRLGFVQEEFAGVLAAYSLLHLSVAGATDALKEVHRILKPSGVLALMLKKGNGEQRMDLPLAPDRRTSVTMWEEEKISRVLLSVGFSVDHLESKKASSPDEIQADKILVLARKVS